MTTALETRCSFCDGTGWAEAEDSEKATHCGECGGVGYLLTNEGRRVLAFLRRWAFVEVNGESAAVEGRDE